MNILGKITFYAAIGAFTLFQLQTIALAAPTDGKIHLLPSDRSIKWSPGIPAGLPNYPTAVNVRQFGVTGDGRSDATAGIQAALLAAPENSAVLLPAGTYKISATIDIPAAKVLRGEGPERTIILCSTPSKQSCLSITQWPGDKYYRINSGAEKGSTEITITGSNNISPGEYVELRQDNDFNKFSCGYKGCSASMPGWGDAVAGQVIKVKGISNNRITLERPLYYTYNDKMRPRLRSSKKAEYAGIEDLYLERVNRTGSGSNISLVGAAHCWVTNVRSENTLSAHVDIHHGSYGCEIRDSIFTGTHLKGGGGQGYGVAITQRSSDNLVENCIFNKLRHSMIVASGACGNVFAYNYSHDPSGANKDDKTINYLFPDVSLHGHYSYMNLWEGNVVQQVKADNVWGSNAATTFFRNRILRTSSEVTASKIQKFSHIEIEKNNLLHNLIGNELGKPGQVALQEVIQLDHTVTASTLLHGNYNYITNKYGPWAPSLPRQLPDSLYRTNKPCWWDNSPWPPFGPEIAPRSKTTPAQLKFEMLRDNGRI